MIFFLFVSFSIRCGTDEWMAPETMMGLDVSQIESARSLVSPRVLHVDIAYCYFSQYNQTADVFSFGVFISEMIFRAEPRQRSPGQVRAMRYCDVDVDVDVSLACFSSYISNLCTMCILLQGFRFDVGSFQRALPADCPRGLVRTIAHINSLFLVCCSTRSLVIWFTDSICFLKKIEILG